MKMRMILILLFSALIACGAGYLGMPLAAKMRMASILQGAGFQDAHVGGVNRIPGGYVFTAIRLDKNDFSTVERIALQTAQPGGTTMVIDKIVLTGDWKSGFVPAVEGWTAPPGLKTLAAGLAGQGISSVTINSAQFDVMLPQLGLVRLEAKGQFTPMTENKASQIQAMVWSIQQKMKIRMNVTGEFAPNGIASLDFEISDGKIDIPAFAASRMGGWIILNHQSETAPWTISTQVMAGMARLYDFTINNLTFSTQGDTQDSSITIQAGGVEPSKYSLSADMRMRSNDQDHVSVTLRAENFGQNPGASLVFDSRAQTGAELLNGGSLAVADLAGKVWSKGTLRKEGNGYALDISDLDFQSLLGSVGFLGIDATGSGTGLLVFRAGEKGNVVIDSGLLVNDGPVHISRNDGDWPKRLVLADPRDEEFLSGFSADKIEIAVGGSPASGLTGQIVLTGKPANKDSSEIIKMGY